jgi:death-on-curing protein
MIRYLSVAEVLELHRRVIDVSGGSQGLRDLGSLESAVAQPKMTFGGEDLYGSLPDKAAALAFSLILNHPFIDGNKRIGHAAMEVFLFLNGYELHADVGDQERIILELAAGMIERDAFVGWVKHHVREWLE